MPMWIALTDTDVFVIGYASSTGAFHSYYWTREGYFPLTEGPYDCHAYAMVLVGGQVYAAGTLLPTTSWSAGVDVGTRSHR